MNSATPALARASSPAMKTSSGRPWARTTPKMVLNAFTTLALAGAALATSCAIGDGQPVGSGIEGVADVDDDLARERVSVLGDDRKHIGVQQGHDDDVPGRDGAEFSRRGAAAKTLGQVSGLGLIAADDLDSVAARHCQRADGAGHVPGADDADDAHEMSCLDLQESTFSISNPKPGLVTC